MTNNELINQYIAEAKAYADIDDDSPHRAAFYWLTTDLEGMGAELTTEEIKIRMMTIWHRTFTDEEAIQICRDHGAQI